MLEGFGEHREFQGAAEWLVKFRNPFGAQGQLVMEPSFFTNELEFYSLAILTYLHARKHGGRYYWLWWTTILHGLTTELVSYWVPQIDNFWHAQSTFMFFGQREPLHIMCLYPGYIYTASVAVYRLGLSEITGACAVALFVLLLDIPYDIMGIKLLWWTWSDEDSNIFDRNYWVPWTSYYFHLTFACAFDLILQRSRRYFVGMSGMYSADDIQRMPFAQQRVAENWKGELKAALVTGLFAMPFGIVQFIPGYHWFKDIFGVHAEVTTCLLAAIYALVFMYGLQHSKPVNTKEIGEREEGRGDKKSGNGKWYLDECYLAMLIHFFHYAVLVVFTEPGKKAIIGLQETAGAPPGSGGEFDCLNRENVSYPYPLTPHAFPGLKGDLFDVTVSKRPYICPYGELMDEKYMDFTCPEGKNQEWIPGNQWYWICGTNWADESQALAEPGSDFKNHIEYILIIWGLCFIGINAYTQAMCYPRSLYEQIRLGEFPRYYKTDIPRKMITEIKEDRINQDGVQEFKVTQMSVDGEHEQTTWETRQNLVQDCVGQAYGERGALYGQLPDTYGGSTRDRLRTYDGYKHAMERLKLFEEHHAGKRTPVSGISYQGAVPRSAGPVLTQAGMRTRAKAKAK